MGRLIKQAIVLGIVAALVIPSTAVGIKLYQTWTPETTLMLLTALGALVFTLVGGTVAIEMAKALRGGGGQTRQAPTLWSGDVVNGQVRELPPAQQYGQLPAPTQQQDSTVGYVFMDTANVPTDQQVTQRKGWLR